MFVKIIGKTMDAMTEKTVSPESTVSPLERRSIEIELAASFVDLITKRYGSDAAQDMLTKVVEDAAAKSATLFLMQYPNPTLHDLYEIWNILGGDGRLDIVLDELTEKNLKFRVLKCKYAEMYQSKGKEAIGIAFSCKRDEPFAKALMPHITVQQSKTILEGNAHCAFEYSLEEV
jgi:hypothetical protein